MTNEEKQFILDWILNNPHAAMEIAVTAHSTGWRGCHCDLDNAKIRRMASTLKSDRIKTKEELLEVF